MTPHEKRRSPLTDRMAGDMKIRNLAPATIDAYTYHAQCFANFIENRWTARPSKTSGTSSCT